LGVLTKSGQAHFPLIAKNRHLTHYRAENEAQTRTPILASRAVGSPGERLALYAVKAS
jgi:hypothetical protein